MNSQALIALVGVGVGFLGGLTVEWYWGRSALAREAADRRERFRVETLTEL